MPCALEHSAGVLLQLLHISFTRRTIEHPCLAETAPADAAALDLQHDSVLCRLDERHDRRQRIRRVRHICHDLFFHGLRGMRIVRRKGFQRPVSLIFCIIKHRDIESFDLCSPLQKFHPASSCSLPLLICVQELVINSLSFADIENIKECRKGLRIVRARAASDHDRILVCPIRRIERYPTQIQDLQDIRIAHFKLDRNSQKIKLSDRILRLKGEQRDILFPHHFVQIRPRRIDPLTPYVFPAVEHIVKDLDAQMGHSDLVHIREAHTEADVHLFLVLHDRVHLAADIAGGLLNLHQNLIV